MDKRYLIFPDGSYIDFDARELHKITGGKEMITAIKKLKPLACLYTLAVSGRRVSKHRLLMDNWDDYEESDRDFNNTLKTAVSELRKTILEPLDNGTAVRLVDRDYYMAFFPEGTLLSDERPKPPVITAHNEPAAEGIDNINDAKRRRLICERAEQNIKTDSIPGLISDMTNNAEIKNTIEGLVSVGLGDSRYCRLLEARLTNNIYKKRVILLYLEKGMEDLAYSLFLTMTNERYKCETLEEIHSRAGESFGRFYASAGLTKEEYSERIERLLKAVSR